MTKRKRGITTVYCKSISSGEQIEEINARFEESEAKMEDFTSRLQNLAFRDEEIAITINNQQGKSFPKAMEAHPMSNIS